MTKFEQHLWDQVKKEGAKMPEKAYLVLLISLRDNAQAKIEALEQAGVTIGYDMPPEC